MLTKEDKILLMISHDKLMANATTSTVFRLNETCTNKERQMEIAIFLIKYIVSDYIHLSPMEFIEKVDETMISSYLIDKYIPKLQIPREIDFKYKEDLFYLGVILYPEIYKYTYDDKVKLISDKLMEKRPGRKELLRNLSQMFFLIDGQILFKNIYRCIISRNYSLKYIDDLFTLDFLKKLTKKLSLEDYEKCFYGDDKEGYINLAIDILDNNKSAKRWINKNKDYINSFKNI